MHPDPRIRSARPSPDDGRPFESDTSDAASLPARRSRVQRRWRVGLGRLGVVLLGLLTPLLVVEALLRIFGAVAPGEYQTASFNAMSDAFGRLNIANRAGWKRSGEFVTHVRLNSKGLRGPEISYEKPAGTYRVLVIGDSFTFGAQVDEEETFVVRLGEYLRAEAGRAGAQAPDIETINGGVDGWNTYNELAWLQTDGVRYEPDQVILMFYTGNDPGENYDWMKALKRQGVETAVGSDDLVHRLRRTLSNASSLYALFETGVLLKLAAPPNLDDLDVSSLRTRRSQDADRKDRGWEISADLLRQMHQFCKARRVGLTVVGIPTYEYVIGGERPERGMQSVGQDAGVVLVDLLEPFRATSDDLRQTLYFPRDRHWTAAGHDLAARIIAPRLVGDLMTRSTGAAR